MAVALGILATTYVNPVGATVGGLHNQLVEVGVMLQEVELLFAVSCIKKRGGR